MSTERPLDPVGYDLVFHGQDPATAWRVRAVEVVEELSGAWTATVDLGVEDEAADGGELHLRAATLRMARVHTPAARHEFSGIVRSVELLAPDHPSRRACRVRLEPAFAFLGDEVATRRFEDMTVPAILGVVLREGLGRFPERTFEMRLARAGLGAEDERGYSPREHCVQYGESTLAFCRRLMAEEGMSFFHEPGETGERLVIADDNRAFRPLDEAAIPYACPAGRAARAETVHELRRVGAQAPAGVKLAPFDFVHPDGPWRGGAGDAPSATAPGEIFDPRPNVALHGFTDHQYTRSNVVSQSRLRLEQAALASRLRHGTGAVLAFAPGRLFTLHPGGEELLPDWACDTLLITAVRHLGRAEDAGTGDPGDYVNEFTCLPAAVPFRAPRVPKPFARKDLAEVVAEAPDDPIWTDRHGRVRVRFLADRAGDAERASAWLPLDQGWAGAGFGMQSIPRAGMLVVVDYTFGDPDRPVITGALPTARNQPPSPLPEQKTRSTLRTQSLRDGARDTRHFHELTLDDAAGVEELFLRAGLDLRRKVLHDDRTQIDRDEARMVGRDQRLTVEGNREETVRAGETIAVDGSRRTTIENDDLWTVARVEGGAGASLDVADGEQSLAVAGHRDVVVAGEESATFAAGRAREVTGDDALGVTRRRATTADELWAATQGGSAASLAAGDAALDAAADLHLETAGGRLALAPEGKASLTVQALRLICGGSQITLGEDRIVLRANHVVARGAKGAVELGPAGAVTKGAEVSASAVMINELKAPIVIISDVPGSVDVLAAKRHDVDTEGESAERRAAITAPAQESR